MCRYADGAYSGTAAAVRHGEGLVQVEVAYVGSDEAWVGDAYLAVHVGSVHIDLTSVLVDDAAYLADLHLEYSVGRRIGDHNAGQAVLVGLGDHDAGQAVLVGLGLLAQLVHVDVAVLVAADQDNVESGHGRAGGVGSVSGGGDDDGVARALSLSFEIAADGHQAGVLTGGAGVGLQGAAVKSGDDAEVMLQL